MCDIGRFYCFAIAIVCSVELRHKILCIMKHWFKNSSNQQFIRDQISIIVLVVLMFWLSKSPAIVILGTIVMLVSIFRFIKGKNSVDQ